MSTSCTPCGPAYRRYSPYCRFIEVSRATPQVYLSVAPSIQHNGSVLTFNHDAVYLELRRKGCETLLGRYNAWRRDENGAIGFYFDDTLFAQAAGFFIGDVYINCIYCFSVQLRMAPCEASVVDCYTQPIKETCGYGECAALQTIGVGSIGGMFCPPAASACGTTAPYFPLDNPLPPPVVGPTSPCRLPLSVAGISTIG